MKPADKKTTKARTPRKVLGHDTKGLIMVRSAIDPEARFFVASELADDNSIEREVAGQMIQECVYEFPGENGKMVRGLTIQGVREATRVINRMRNSGMKVVLGDRMFTDEKEYNGQKGIEAKTFAVDHISGMRNWGVKFEAYTKARRGGGTYQDTFVVEKAVSKAQRNALAGLIPLPLKLKVINQFVKQGSVATLPPPPKELIAPRAPTVVPKEKLPDIVRRKIEQSTKPEELSLLAQKIEGSKQFSPAERKMLAGMARGKANTIAEEVSRAN